MSLSLISYLGLMRKLPLGPKTETTGSSGIFRLRKLEVKKKKEKKIGGGLTAWKAVISRLALASVETEDMGETGQGGGEEAQCRNAHHSTL